MLSTKSAFFLLLTFSGVSSAQAPASIDLPASEKLVLQARGEGVQIYMCTEGHGKWAWMLMAPEAKLLDTTGKTIGTHSAGPKWKLADGSEVTGKLVAAQPHAGTIPWLLLSATSTGGEGKLGHVDHVRRTETQGGLASAEGCDPAHASAESRVPYSATYSFYQAD